MSFQRSVGVLFLQGIRSRVCQLVQPVNIPAFKRLLELCLARVPDHSLQHIVSNAVKLLLFHPIHRLHRYFLVLQVCQLHPGVPLHLLRQFFPAQAACLVHSRTLHRSAVHKLSVKRLPACLIHPVFKVPHGIVVHLVLYARPCRGPRIRAVHPVRLVHHGVNGVAAKYQRYRPVLCVPLPGFHHRNGRRRHPAQLQRLAQVLLGQVVHRHQFLLAVHLHRCAKRKPHCFLHSCIVFLAFASILCYTLVRDLRPAAPRIFGFHVGFAEGLYFCLHKIHDIIKNLFCVWFDCSQNIGFVCVFAHLHSDLPTVECLCVFVVSRFAVNLVCRCNDLIQICRHPHLVCIGCPVFPL